MFVSFRIGHRWILSLLLAAGASACLPTQGIVRLSDMSVASSTESDPSPTPSPSPAFAVPRSSGGQPGTFAFWPLGTTSADWGYVEHLPAGYDAGDPSVKWPLILFFGGIGETGPGTTEAGLRNMLSVGPLGMAYSQGWSFPAVMVAPQALGWWDGGYTTTTARGFLQFCMSRYAIDPDRVYVTGLSLGGEGTWLTASENADIVAATIPIAANLDVGLPASAADLAIWAFHDFDDTTAWYYDSPNRIRDIGTYVYGAPALTYPADLSTAVRTLQLDSSAAEYVWHSGIVVPTPDAGGKQYFFTSYPTGGHDAWTRTYGNEDVWSWLFHQHK